MAYIYSITNNINQKQYIGLTRRSNPYDRWKEHISASKYNPEYAIHRAISKYGIDNFKFRVLEECSLDKVEEREIHYISKFNTFYEGYNRTPGGNIRYDTDAKPITQYNKKGERIQDFASITDAGEYIGKEITAMSRCANGERFSAYGYRWSWKGEKLPIVKTQYLKPIYAYNRNGEYKEWTSRSEALREMKCDKSNLQESINSPTNNKKQCEGWYYFSKENEVEFDDITFAKKYKPTREKSLEMVRIRDKKNRPYVER